MNWKATNRNFQWDPETHARGGRVIEILSEHTCQGMLQGTTPLCNVVDGRIHFDRKNWDLSFL